jgi:hypothetical protein
MSQYFSKREITPSNPKGSGTRWSLSSTGRIRHRELDLSLWDKGQKHKNNNFVKGGPNYNDGQTPYALKIIRRSDPTNEIIRNYV